MFLSIDSRTTHHNPLYKAWKAKSFTDDDITLHFLIFDILYASDVCLSLNEIIDEIDKRLSSFDNPKTFDASTIRKKLSEYSEQGLILTEKTRKTMRYCRAYTINLNCTDALNFFSEIAEKRAQANVITRREETASTRSLLNTAKLLDENKTLYKLKELEHIERICENVGNINLNGNADVLSQLMGLLHTGTDY